MSKENKPLTKKQIRTQFWQSFLATIADNTIEIGWALIMSWYPAQAVAKENLDMFALNDSVWTIFSVSYYSFRTSMKAILPAFMVGKNPEDASKIIKNTLYAIYFVLTPFIVLGLIFMPQFLTQLGVEAGLLEKYTLYFRLSLVSIFIACPTGLIIPAWLRSIFEAKKALILDNLVAYVMLIGAWIAVYIFNAGTTGMIMANIFANSIPLLWFIIFKPLKKFYKRGFEFDFKIQKQLFKIAKFEAIRRLLPRLSFLFASSSLLGTGAVLSAHYLFDLLKTLLEGIMETSAGLAIVVLSHNKGLGLKGKSALKGFTYILKIALISNSILIFLAFLTSNFWVHLITPNIEIQKYITDPFVWTLFLFVSILDIHFYTFLAITRTQRQDLNPVAQMAKAVPALLILSAGIHIFVNTFKFELRGYYIALLISNLTSSVILWWYLRKNDVKIPRE